MEKVETMIKSGNHLLDIINTILDLAKIEAGKIEIINERFGIKRFFDIIEKIFLYKAIEKKLDINFIFESDIKYPNSFKTSSILVNNTGLCKRVPETSKSKYFIFSRF